MDLNEPPTRFTLLISAAWVWLGGYGGMMAYLMRAADANQKPTFWRTVLEFNAAVSIGIVVTLVCMAMNWNTLWTGVMVSSTGWIGAKSMMSIFEALMRKRLGIPQDNTNGDQT